MKVLYLSARFPWPPYRGDRLTGCNLIRALARKHEVTLLSFVDGCETTEGLREIGAVCRRIQTVRISARRSWLQAWGGMLLPEPSQVSYYRSGAMRERVRALVAEEKPDAIFVQLFRMAPFVNAVDHPCKVLFLADSLALSLRRAMPYQRWYRRPAVNWEQMRVSAYEPRVARDFRENWVLSDVDRRDLEARGCPRVAVLPHGVDERLFALPLERRSGARVTFLGNLSVPHNVDAAVFLAREIWPRIHAARPDAELQLVGADPLDSVRALGALPGVRVVGPVPSLEPTWRESALLVAPLRFSAGIQNKVLEAMAAGVPVVTTPQAAEAIRAQNKVHLRIGADAQRLADAALDLLAPETDSSQLVRNARELVHRHYSWQTLVQRLEELAGSRS